ncbi:hypothetical protein [Streptomyces sp. NPDC007856]|uniref:hypothetical protein n=1 Tax=Streptomyces sp. NPDC007856 TaxID=3364781 RepID=UPI0036828998
MAERPPTSWRQGTAEEAEELAAGTLCPSAPETDEREELCDCIDASLAEHGVDVVALTARHGLDGYQLTDKWRKW